MAEDVQRPEVNLQGEGAEENWKKDVWEKNRRLGPEEHRLKPVWVILGCLGWVLIFTLAMGAALIILNGKFRT